VLCWYGLTFQNIVTPLPSAFLVLLVSIRPPPSSSPTFGSAGTLLLVALRPPPDLCFLRWHSLELGCSSRASAGGAIRLQELSSLHVSPRRIIEESLFPQKLGPVGLYYGLAYMCFDLVKWVCFPLLVVSTVRWRCFSFRLGSCRGFWFMPFRPVFSSP